MDEPSSPPIIVVGAGGHARVVVEAMAPNAVVGHVSPGTPSADPVLGPHLGDDSQVTSLAAAGNQFALGIGFVDRIGAQRRAALLARLRSLGADLATVVHPTAVVSPSASVGTGAFIAAGAVVGPGAVIGAAALINTGAVVDHDCRIGENTHVAPGAILSGDVKVGNDTLVGAGSVIRQGTSIGHEVTIGAGSVVVGALHDGVTAFGVPARVLD